MIAPAGSQHPAGLFMRGNFASMSFEAVIFDADGTLLDTLEDLADSMNGALRELGFPVHETPAYRYFVGGGMQNLVRRALPETARNDETLVARGLAAMRDIYGRNWDRKTKPYDGVPDLLDDLSGRNVKMAVLSNKLHDSTLLVIERYFSKWKFEVVFGERPGVPVKPDPAGAIEIATIFGLAPQKILFLGDTGIDMRTAFAAGR